MLLEKILILTNILPLTILIIYAIRQYVFVYTALRHKQPESLSNYQSTHSVSVLIPSRNEEKVIERTLQYMSKLDYPKDKIEIIILNDASTDRTSEIAHEWSKKYPYIHVIDRPIGGLGKGDVLNQGVRESKNDIILVFDADYTPAPDTIKKLVRWFDNPKVGLVQGKIHVVNKDENLLTKMIHAERCAGFLCDLLAREKLKVTNQYGGTAGGFRRELIQKVGEWESGTFCEDTDLTCRTLLAGYKVKYDETVNCGEEAPDRLKVYYKQRYRWIRGHVICGLKYTKKFITSPFLSIREKIDGVLWLNLNIIPIFILISLGASIHLLIYQLNLIPPQPYSYAFLIPQPYSYAFLIPQPYSYAYLIPEAYSYAFMIVGLGSTIGTVFAGLYKVRQIRYLIFAVSMLINSYIMCFIVSTKAYIDILTNRPFKWIKTERNSIMPKNLRNKFGL